MQQPVKEEGWGRRRRRRRRRERDAGFRRDRVEKGIGSLTPHNV